MSDEATSSGNPFARLYQFALAIWAKSQDLAGRWQADRQLLVGSQEEITHMQLELRRMALAAIREWRGTGDSRKDVTAVVNRVERGCNDLFKWAVRGGDHAAPSDETGFALRDLEDLAAAFHPVESAAGTSIGDGPAADSTAAADDLPRPDGPFDADGFRYRGTEVWFGRAGKQRALMLALWDQKKRRPQPARPIQDVITEVYGAENDTSDPAFRQLCSDAQKKLDAADVSLKIESLQGKVQLTPRPR
jgi:hypothetical protein